MIWRAYEVVAVLLRRVSPYLAGKISQIPATSNSASNRVYCRGVARSRRQVGCLTHGLRKAWRKLDHAGSFNNRAVEVVAFCLPMARELWSIAVACCCSARPMFMLWSQGWGSALHATGCRRPWGVGKWFCKLPTLHMSKQWAEEPRKANESRHDTFNIPLKYEETCSCRNDVPAYAKRFLFVHFSTKGCLHIPKANAWSLQEKQKHWLWCNIN